MDQTDGQQLLGGTGRIRMAVSRVHTSTEAQQSPFEVTYRYQPPKYT